MLVKQTPVNFIKGENGKINGFNKNGDLVLIGDSYGNYYYINYDKNNNISYISDESGVVARFNYSAGFLTSISDNRGRTVKYGYDGSKLNSITYPDGTNYTIDYSGSRVGSITSGDGVQQKFTYISRYLKSLAALATLPSTETLSELTISYGTISGAHTVTISDQNGNTETYKFDSERKLIGYSKADRFSSIKDCVFTTVENETGKTVTEKTTTYKPSTKTVTEIRQYNNIDLLESKTVDWQNISDTVKVRTEIVYSYDVNNKLIKETTTKILAKADIGKRITSVINYSYNAHGSLVLTESYIVGEELISGKNYIQYVYDENGQVIKTVSWNSLDSSSKFYSESVCNKNGQVTSDKGETGEVSAEYEYVDGANVVNSVKYPNGSKLAYGRNPYNDQITSVTQSTEDGESNSNEIVYKNGLPAKVKSGNTFIDYTYDNRGRKKELRVNGVKQVTYSYKDYSYNESDNVYTLGEQTTVLNNGDGKTTTITQSKTGVLDSASGKIKVTETKTGCFIKEYDENGRLKTEIGSTEGARNYTYDSYNNLISISGRSLKENYTYNDLGEVTQKTLTGAVTQTYTYTYKNDAARPLDYITFGNYKFKPLTDVNGRYTGKEIYIEKNKLAAEYITYRKVGDHATNMPAAVWYGRVTNINDSIKYKYDSCGNISQIIENGHVVTKYTYDSLNRLIREDNKALDKTVLFKYDHAGNITERCEYAYTAKQGEELSELECTHYSYDYEGDKLRLYNNKSFVYDNLGCPTYYRNKQLIWQNGKLIKFGNITFGYDGLGKRAVKNKIQFTYDNDGRLVKQNNGLEFIYDASGVVGIKHIKNVESQVVTNEYFYRKDAQGNIIAILDSFGLVVVRYVYDAWGNHAVLD
ncbi:MAG: hypothetical protein K2N14_04655, partial [Clostridia bacterium]|nr:hypothetical protein [Clostridia bacterium]